MRCLQCGTGIPIGQPTCARCGALRPTLPADFAQVERDFVELHARTCTGQLGQADLRAELYRRRVQDQAGRYWTLNTDGEWYLYSGTQWLRQDPPTLPAAARPPVAPPRVAPRPAAVTTQPDPKKRRGWLWVGCGLLLALVVAACAYILISGRQEYLSSPMLVENAALPAVELPRYTLAAPQQQALDRLGYPDSFTILFYQETDAHGAPADRRFETWSYYRQATGLSFLDGELVGEDLLELPVGELVALPYRPEQFSAYMSLEQVLASAGLETYLIIPAEEAMVTDAEIYFGEQLSFGLQGDELVFVETLALEVEP